MGWHHRERVLIAQKRVIRLIFNLQKTQSCRNFFKHLLTFPCVYIIYLCKYVKKKLNKFETNSHLHNYPTRHGSLLKMQKHKTALYEKSPLLAGIKFFNSLPSKIKETASLYSFKKELRKYLVEASYYSVAEFLNDNHR